MIKTDISTQEPIFSASKNWPMIGLSLLVLAALIGAISFDLVDQGSNKILVSGLKQGVRPELPLSIPSSSPLSTTKSNRSSDSQSSDSSTDLGASGVDLQNNIPTGNSNTPVTNNLQSAGGVNTGKTINPSLGF